MEPYGFHEGTAPLLVSMPHTGTCVPPEILQRLSPAARALPDTDWHLERLYDFLDALGASRLVGTHSRYVVDLNRPPTDENLYPGQDTTGIVPLDTFAKEPVYLEGREPRKKELAERVERYWRPYHARLRDELQRLRRVHGYALLWDAHSILSEVPRFFTGRLPEFNLGTADGRSCAPGIGQALLKKVSGYSAVLNGRFKGGYITRHYGDPANGVHAVQLELACITYMEEQPPFAFREDRAAGVRPVLRALVETMLARAAK